MKPGEMRFRSDYGGPESNAQLRYVEVYEILAGEESEVYQPVQVKLLRLANYRPAWTDEIEATNATFSIATMKGSEHHGALGNGIDVVFEIDGGIDPLDAQASFASDTLTIKVKNNTRTWGMIQTAVNAVAGFVLQVDDESAVFASGDASLTGTLTGGVNGGYEPVGEAFPLGEYSTKDEVQVDDRFWASFNRSAARWEKVAGGGAGATIRIVLIDQDIPGVKEHDPQSLLVAADIELTAQEIEDEYTVVLQDPPDDDYGVNLVDSLNLWEFKRNQVDLKYYTGEPLLHAGTATAGASTTITLEADSDAAAVDDFYNGDTIELTGGTGSGQTATITDYDADTRVVTVDAAWSTNPDNTTTYEITSTKNLKLVTTIIDDAENFQKIVRYATMSVTTDDGKVFELGEYGRADYPDFPENDDFPPAGLPEGFLSKRYRGIVINGILITALCKVLPPPELPEEE